MRGGWTNFFSVGTSGGRIEWCGELEQRAMFNSTELIVSKIEDEAKLHTTVFPQAIAGANLNVSR